MSINWPVRLGVKRAHAESNLMAKVTRSCRRWKILWVTSYTRMKPFKWPFKYLTVVQQLSNRKLLHHLSGTNLIRLTDGTMGSSSDSSSKEMEDSWLRHYIQAALEWQEGLSKKKKKKKGWVGGTRCGLVQVNRYAGKWNANLLLKYED